MDNKCKCSSELPKAGTGECQNNINPLVKLPPEGALLLVNWNNSGYFVECEVKRILHESEVDKMKKERQG